MLSNVSQETKINIFQFSDKCVCGGWGFPWHPKGGCTSPHKFKGILADIIAKASRLNNFYRLEIFYRHLHSLFFIRTRKFQSRLDVLKFYLGRASYVLLMFLKCS